MEKEDVRSFPAVAEEEKRKRSVRMRNFEKWHDNVKGVKEAVRLQIAFLAKRSILEVLGLQEWASNPSVT